MRNFQGLLFMGFCGGFYSTSILCIASSFPFYFNFYCWVLYLLIICTTKFNILPSQIHLTHCDQNNPKIMTFSPQEIFQWLPHVILKCKFHACRSKTYFFLVVVVTYFFFISLSSDLRSGSHGLLPRPWLGLCLT